jgi:hypothetical protein
LDVLNDLAADQPIREHHFAVHRLSDPYPRAFDDRDHPADKRVETVCASGSDFGFWEF